MIVKREFKNVGCDGCGSLLDEETWWDADEPMPGILEECGWKALGDRHYCGECWHRDDDDSIVTADGRKYDDDGKEITGR